MWEEDEKRVEDREEDDDGLKEGEEVAEEWSPIIRAEKRK